MTTQERSQQKSFAAKRRALEDAAYRKGLHPTRVFPVLFPVHEVEVRATTRVGRPYGLIDKFLERSIAEGGITTITDLADFLGLDAVLVDRALRVLRRIGHLRPHDDELVLTPLAHESLSDGTRYEIRREERRKIYFEGFQSQPLHRRHYEDSSAFLTPVEAETRAKEERFSQLLSTRPFRKDALAALEKHPERGKFNLPLTVENPREIQPEYVFLPLYLVRAIARGGHLRYLAYDEANVGEFDEGLSELCTQQPEIARALQNETPSVAEQKYSVQKWLDKNAPSGRSPFQHPDGSWQVNFAPEDFEPVGSRSIRDVGSFVDLRTVVVRMWCQDHDVRRRALLKRVESQLDRFRYKPQDRADELRMTGDQLEFPGLDESRLRALATEAGRSDLVDRLDQVVGTPAQDT
ncbi:hypothetical protein FHR84_000535 [Actinopolyspora biskrensis]|uniref:Uncharacterized protein n=1 Tax=Actinopolyspora biskrensis TaxID=1470178 RepID=A0A852YR53_9ACTN|nr:hypothetical protein [Actinopolyspora biskrensis]NYH77221.1 hypothetical protein [Actinopolyspora biskrensis]